MRKTLTILAAVAIVVTAATVNGAPTVLDAASRCAIAIDRRTTTPHAPSRTEAEVSPSLYRPAILEFGDVDIDEAIAELVARGAVIYYRRADMALASLPIDEFGDYDFSPMLNSLSIGRRSAPALDRLRQYARIDAVHSGIEGIGGFDGSGVITGLCDIGFDPHHPGFGGRVSYLTQYIDTAGVRIEAADPQAIDAWITDDDDAYHATHVCNIMAGGYTSLPYHGAAPGAEIAASTSMLHDPAILAGVEDILAYGRSRNMPTVVNLSLGSYNGPHDGTDLFGRYMAMLAEEAPIVMSAGNEGNWYGQILHTFTEEEPVVLTTLESSITWDGMRMVGCTDVWSADERPFDLRISIYDATDRCYIYSTDWFTPGAEQTDLIVDSTDDPALAVAYDGRIALAAEINARNGRAMAEFDYDLKSKAWSHLGAWSRYSLTVEVRGEPGVSVAVQADCQYSYFKSIGLPGHRDGTSRLSFSNIACAPGVIGVGAMCSRSQATMLDGIDRRWNYIEGRVASFSSYGTLIDGRHKPDICAPGAMIISAASGPYIAKHPDERNLTDMVTIDGKPTYWMAEGGTSMASPTVAGIFALWLQADPTLTPTDLLEIATLTANTDFPDIENQRWGAGCIDAEAGLRHIVQQASNTPPLAQLITITSTDDRRIEVSHLLGNRLDVVISDMSGRIHRLGEQLTPGIYVVRASDGHESVTRKLAIL